MSEPHEKVIPTQFDAVNPAAPGPGADVKSPGDSPGNSPRSSGTPRWVLPALAGLLTIALVVFFWLPRHVDTPEVPLDQPVAVKPPQKTTELSPWQEAQDGKLRKQAQDILSTLLDVQFELEDLGVDNWAREAMDSARQMAADGDGQYRQQDFIAAGETYTEALQKMQDIRDSRQQLFEDAVSRGEQALLENTAAEAIPALETALLIEPGDPKAEQLLARARKLDEVLALLDQAGTAREKGQLEDSEALLQQAAALDPENLAVSAALADVKRANTRNRFNAAMTAGYNALDKGLYDRAESSFRQAQKLMPASGEAESALQESRAARTSDKIGKLRNAAEKAAAAEQWQDARDSYAKILAMDNSLVFARSGMIQTRQRAGIDSQLRKTIAEPERLGDEAIYQQARRLYSDASKLQQKGPLLVQQLQQLSKLLETAKKPVPVLLKSDELTQVTVYKVARLGTFQEHRLELLPGTYTVVGVRPGYRDVRRQFRVSPDSSVDPISIICTEQI